MKRENRRIWMGILWRHMTTEGKCNQCCHRRPRRLLLRQNRTGGIGQRNKSIFNFPNGKVVTNERANEQHQHRIWMVINSLFNMYAPTIYCRTLEDYIIIGTEFSRIPKCVFSSVPGPTVIIMRVMMFYWQRNQKGKFQSIWISRKAPKKIYHNLLIADWFLIAMWTEMEWI